MKKNLIQKTIIINLTGGCSGNDLLRLNCYSVDIFSIFYNLYYLYQKYRYRTLKIVIITMIRLKNEERDEKKNSWSSLENQLKVLKGATVRLKKIENFPFLLHHLRKSKLCHLRSRTLFFQIMLYRMLFIFLLITYYLLIRHNTEKINK